MKFNENKISELINKFNKLELTYLDHSSFDMIETEFNFYYDLFSELVTPVLQKIRNKYGEDVSDKIIFSHFAIENNKFYLAFYDPFLYVDLEGYLNNTEMIIKKLVGRVSKMENTLNDVIEKLESLGYTIENDVTNTILEIEKLNNNSSNLIDVKPIYLGKDNSDLFIISDFVGEKLKRMNFEIYAYPRKIVLEQPTFNNLIDVIKQMSY